MKKIKKISIKKPAKISFRKSFGTVVSRNGAYSATAIAIVIIIALLINLACSKLPAAVQQIDISDNKIYEISDTTKELIKDLEYDIDITVFAETDSIDKRLTTFLDKYTALSKHLKLEIIDPVLHPSALTEYETDSDTILVSCEETGLSTSIYLSDILVQDMYSYYYYGTGEVTSFDGDGQLTAAINQICGGEEKKVYYLTDHGETDLPSSVTSLMTKSGISTEGLSLLMKGEIPDDCDMIISNGPASDMSESEIKLLNKYIKSGGEVVLLLSEDSPDSGNLVDFMKKYGITQEAGFVADMERNYQQNYYYIFPNITASSDMVDNLNTGMVLMVNSKGFSIDSENVDEEITVSSILETSSYGYMVSDDKETQGTFTVAAQAGYTAASGESEDSSAQEVMTGSLTVYGSNTLIDESLTASFSGLDNNSLFMNSVTSAIGDVTNLSIEAKSLETQYNTPQYGGLISILIIFILPAAIVIIGFVKWMRRRKM